MSVGQRATWLSGGTFAPDVYQRLFRIYRQEGREEDAREIVIAMHKARRAEPGVSRLVKAWDWLLGWSVRYGYAIQRPLFVALVLWAASLWPFYYAWSHNVMSAVAAGPGVQVSASQCTSAYPCFFPISYSVELLLPVVNLHQVGYWLPAASAGWWGKALLAYTWVAIVVGWLIGLVVVAGVGQMFTRRD